MDKKPGGWQAGRDKAKRDFAKSMALGRHWSKRWKKEPEFMRRMLEQTIAKNRKRWEAKRHSTKILADSMPKEIPSHAIREEIRLALSKFGERTPTDPKTVHKVLVRLRLWGMATFDPDALLWRMTRQSTP